MSQKKKGILPSQLAIRMARIVDAVEKGVFLKVIRIEENYIYIVINSFPKAKKDREVYLKNLFLYTRLKKITKRGDSLYVKDIETHEMIGFFKNEQAFCLLADS
jgi:intein/homing endonuclease